MKKDTDDGMLNEMSDDETYIKYQFVKVYNIDFVAADIHQSFKRAQEADSDITIQDFITDSLSVSVENNGDVSMLNIINQPWSKNVLTEIAMFS